MDLCHDLPRREERMRVENRNEEVVAHFRIHLTADNLTGVAISVASASSADTVAARYCPASDFGSIDTY